MPGEETDLPEIIEIPASLEPVVPVPEMMESDGPFETAEAAGLGKMREVADVLEMSEEVELGDPQKAAEALAGSEDGESPESARERLLCDLDSIIGVQLSRGWEPMFRALTRSGQEIAVTREELHQFAPFIFLDFLQSALVGKSSRS
jgi:hypothetical protein